MTDAEYRLYWLKKNGLLNKVEKRFYDRVGFPYKGIQDLAAAFLWDSETDWHKHWVDLEQDLLARKMFEVEFRIT